MTDTPEKNLMRAIMQNDLDKIRELFTKGTELSLKLRPLMFAVISIRYDAVKLLIELGADVNEVNCCGETALYWAKKLNALDITKLLEDAGAKYIAIIPNNFLLQYETRNQDFINHLQSYFYNQSMDSMLNFYNQLAIGLTDSLPLYTCREMLGIFKKYDAMETVHDLLGWVEEYYFKDDKKLTEIREVRHIVRSYFKRYYKSCMPVPIKNYYWLVPSCDVDYDTVNFREDYSDNLNNLFRRGDCFYESFEDLVKSVRLKKGENNPVFAFAAVKPNPDRQYSVLCDDQNKWEKLVELEAYILRYEHVGADIKFETSFVDGDPYFRVILNSHPNMWRVIFKHECHTYKDNNGQPIWAYHGDDIENSDFIENVFESLIYDYDLKLKENNDAKTY